MKDLKMMCHLCSRTNCDKRQVVTPEDFADGMAQYCVHGFVRKTEATNIIEDYLNAVSVIIKVSDMREVWKDAAQSIIADIKKMVK